MFAFVVLRLFYTLILFLYSYIYILICTFSSNIWILIGWQRILGWDKKNATLINNWLISLSLSWKKKLEMMVLGKQNNCTEKWIRLKFIQIMIIQIQTIYIHTIHINRIYPYMLLFSHFVTLHIFSHISFKLCFVH